MATTRKKAQAATAADAKPADVAGASAPAASATTSPTLTEGSGSGASTAPQSAGDGAGNPADTAGDGQGEAVGDQNTGGDTTGQGDGDQDGNGNADLPGGDTSTSTAGDQADQQTGGDTGGDGDQPSDQSEPNDDAPAPVLRRRLLNLCHGRQVLQTLAISLDSGDAAYIDFRDAEHQAACERHIDALRSLNGWGEGEGLLWRDE